MVEVGRPQRPPRRIGAKSDALDAIRAAREALAQDHELAPRRRGDRQALRVLLAIRHRACRDKVSAIIQLKALIVGAPEELRAELDRLVAAVAPWLLKLPGVGPISAAQVLVSWSHAGQLRSEAAFAALAGANPIPASSGQVIRHRLNRSGDRQLNRALHTIVLGPGCPTTQLPAPTPPRRRAEAKSVRDSGRHVRLQLTTPDSRNGGTDALLEFGHSHRLDRAHRRSGTSPQDQAAPSPSAVGLRQGR